MPLGANVGAYAITLAEHTCGRWGENKHLPYFLTCWVWGLFFTCFWDTPGDPAGGGCLWSLGHTDLCPSWSCPSQPRAVTLSFPWIYAWDPVSGIVWTGWWLPALLLAAPLGGGITAPHCQVRDSAWGTYMREPSACVAPAVVCFWDGPTLAIKSPELLADGAQTETVRAKSLESSDSHSPEPLDVLLGGFMPAR